MFTDQAHAYLDPGSGSMVIQVFIGALLASVGLLGFWYGRIKRNILNVVAKVTGKTTGNGQGKLEP